LNVTRTFSFQDSLYQLEAKMVGALSLVESNLDVVTLRFQARNEQMIQSIETAGSPLYFSR
jgi:hypothetical protein